MPYLPNNPSIYVDQDIIEDLVDELSVLLRRNARLRPILDVTVGNQWKDFEQGLVELWSRILLMDSGHDAIVAAAKSLNPILSEDDIDEVCAVFLESSLRILPFHSAAAFTELAEAIAGQVIKALR